MTRRGWVVVLVLGSAVAGGLSMLALIVWTPWWVPLAATLGCFIAAATRGWGLPAPV